MKPRELVLALPLMATIIFTALLARHQFRDMKAEYGEMMRDCNTRITSAFDNQPHVLDYATLSQSEHGAMHDAGEIRPEHAAAIFPVCNVLGDHEAEVGIGEHVQWNETQPEPLIVLPPKTTPNGNVMDKNSGGETDQQ